MNTKVVFLMESILNESPSTSGFHRLFSLTKNPLRIYFNVSKLITVSSLNDKRFLMCNS